MLIFRGKWVRRKPTLICIAGNLCSPQVFDQIRAPKGMQKLYVDYLQGTGPWDMDSLGQSLLDSLEQMEFSDVILAGYSAGGVICLSAAAKDPNKISGLFLSNTGPCSIGHGNPGFVDELKKRYDDETFIRQFLQSCFYKPVNKEMEDALWEYTRHVSKEAACEVSKSLREVDYRDNLRQYKNPVFIVHGILDHRRQKDSVEMMKNSMPQAEVKFLQTGHTPMVEDTAGYQACLDSFIKKVYFNQAL